MAPVAERAQIHTVTGGGGVQLHVREWGNPEGPPILLIHGWSQNHLCWAKQYESALARRVPARGLRPTRTRHVRRTARARALHRRQALGRRRGGDHRPAASGPAGAGRLVLRRLRHLRLPAHARRRADRRDRVRRGCRQAGRGGVRNTDRAGLPRSLRARDGGRPADQHRGDARLPAGVPGEADTGRGVRDRAVLEHRRTRRASAPRSRRGRSTTTTCCERSRCRCWSRTVVRTRWCCRPWPSTSSRHARPPRPPGTTASGMCRSWRSPNASTASWPR